MSTTTLQKVINILDDALAEAEYIEPEDLLADDDPYPESVVEDWIDSLVSAVDEARAAALSLQQTLGV